MRDEDRVFLAEYASRTCLAHAAAALGLYRSAVDADEVAIVVESLVRRVDRPTAASMASERRTPALVQTYVVARLLAQLAAAIEDCAAMGCAIRYRDRGGLFRRYLRSKSAVAGDFWDLVRRGTSLPDLLSIPSLDQLTVDPKDRSLLEFDYANLPPALQQISNIYRGEGVPRPWAGDVQDGEDTPLLDVVNIVVEVVSPEADGTIRTPRVTLLEAYNKIKHRFAVIDDIATLGEAVRADGDSVVHATYPRAPEYAKRLLLNVVAVGQASGEMAALVLKLDEIRALTSPTSSGPRGRRLSRPTQPASR